MQVTINCVCGGPVTVDETYADGHARCRSCNRSIFVPAELFREAHIADAPTATARPAAPATNRPAAPGAAPTPGAEAPAAPSPAAAEPAAPSGSGLPGGSTGSGLGTASKRPVAPPDKSARPIKITPRVEEPVPQPKKKNPLPMVLALVGLLAVVAVGIWLVIGLIQNSDPSKRPIPAAKLGRPVLRVSTDAGTCGGFFISESGHLVTNLELMPSDASLAGDDGATITVEYPAKAGEGWVTKTATVRRVALRNAELQLAVLKVDLPEGTEVSVPQLAQTSSRTAGETWTLVYAAEGQAVDAEPAQLKKSLDYPMNFGVGSEHWGTDLVYAENKALDGAPALDRNGEVFAVMLYLPSSKGQTVLYYLCTMTRPLANRMLNQARGEGG